MPGVCPGGHAYRLPLRANRVAPSSAAARRCGHVPCLSAGTQQSRAQRRDRQQSAAGWRSPHCCAVSDSPAPRCRPNSVGSVSSRPRFPLSPSSVSRISYAASAGTGAPVNLGLLRSPVPLPAALFAPFIAAPLPHGNTGPPASPPAHPDGGAQIGRRGSTHTQVGGSGDGDKAPGADLSISGPGPPAPVGSRPEADHAEPGERTIPGRSVSLIALPGAGGRGAGRGGGALTRRDTPGENRHRRRRLTHRRQERGVVA
jgi:hypothetical protein